MAVFDPAHRMAARHGQPTDADLLRQQDSLVSEAATDIGSDDTHLSFVKTQTLRQSGADDMRHLACRIECKLLKPRMPQCHSPASLDRRHTLPRRPDLPGDLDRSVQRLLEIGTDKGFEENVVAPVLMNKRRWRQSRRQ